MPDNEEKTAGMEHGDFGQAYKGARKFEVQRKRALAELNLADLWPRPDFRAAALSGDVKPSVALLYMAVYDNLRRKAVSRPETDELTLGFWSRMYRSGVGFMRRAWELRQYHTADRLTRAFRASQESLTLTEGERRFATAATAKGRLTPSTSPTDFPASIRMRMYSLQAMGWPEDQDVPDDSNIGVIHVTAEKPVSDYQDGYYPALTTVGGRVVPIRHDPFATKAAAARDAAEELRRRAEMSQLQGGSAVLAYERTGQDWRQGEDVTEEILLTAFGFKGLEFGKSITASERQAFLNGLYDASLDLCEILQAPLYRASCSGRLGIGFGSQGRGAATGAAHFDREQWLMHLTKTRGGGALCHEFAHALDAMMLEAFFDADKLPADTYFLSDLMASYYDEDGRYTISSGVVEMLRGGIHVYNVRAMDSLFESLFTRKRNDSFYRRSEERDTHAGKSYWAQPRELFARAFETFALDRMLAAKVHNEFLVRHVDEYIRDRDSHANSIYPQGYQRQELEKLFSELLKHVNNLHL
ncbi:MULTISPECIES: LPD1 domain-containing protein [Xanthomonas]|uniref:Large polyvalent protein-associated domain-containing protein n=3 Tax=Xanthomonas TaxID=338 RepID=A0AAJ0N6A6_9XANT|nr:MULTISPECIES: LPD1 domain-containing protein [Xanthomonas]MEB1846175.1 LPD1 domain-containing protein [Xanthomonas campestris pv. campestris]APP87298.1 hypothetical protein BI317_24870 [Xanthomonas hortorum pv. gardneri]EGD10775.1 hypothetical protein XVE_0830 [Xanthomonas vesicatoria ATCC 35937]KHM94878.1 hypothetical protein OR60_09700 [Xanthomonas vesicatoria]KHM98649.1 hypothetical protein OR61_00060 [Xanthomonas vesicatoria]